MEPDAFPAGDNSLGQIRPAPSKRPSVSGNRGATIRRRRAGRLPTEIPFRASREIPACRLIHRGSANSVSPLVFPVDARRRVSSVAPLAIHRRLNVPALLQGEPDLLLRELLLLRPIIG